MYAIVNIAGQQYKVEKDQKLFVHRLEDKEGQTVRFDEVLLIDNDKDVLVGEPTIKGAMITGKVLSHPKGDKVLVFKKKRRKGYKVLRGHRQYLTEIQIQEIVEKGAPAKAKAGTKASPAKASDAKEKAAGGEKAAGKAGTDEKAGAAKKTGSGTATGGSKTGKPPAKKSGTGTKTAKTGAGDKSAGSKTTEKKPAAKSSAKPASGKSTGSGGKKS